jgi:hypothetical protein
LKRKIINIRIRIERNRMEFKTSNPVPESVNENYGCKGIELIQKRLKLIYGADFQLTLSRSDNRFYTSLILPV